jgi:hypothetical protein
VSRHFPHGIEHAGVVDSGGLDELSHHLAANVVVIVPGLSDRERGKEANDATGDR